MALLLALPRWPPPRSPWRAACVVLLALGVPPASALAEDPPLVATMSCDPVNEPGRVKCSVEAHATSGRTISWADVVIVELPELATALKGRIGPSDVVSKDASSQRWAFGLVARKSGDGAVKARVRAAICDASFDAGPPRCTPASLDVQTLLHVR